MQQDNKVVLILKYITILAKGYKVIKINGYKKLNQACLSSRVGYL